MRVRVCMSVHIVGFHTCVCPNACVSGCTCVKKRHIDGTGNGRLRYSQYYQTLTIPRSIQPSLFPLAPSSPLSFNQWYCYFSPSRLSVHVRQTCPLSACLRRQGARQSTVTPRGCTGKCVLQPLGSGLIRVQVIPAIFTHFLIFSQH